MLTRPNSTFSFQTYLKPSIKEPLSPDPRCLARCSSGSQSSRNTVTAVNSCIAAVDAKRIPSHPAPITPISIAPIAGPATLGQVSATLSHAAALESRGLSTMLPRSA